MKAALSSNNAPIAPKNKVMFLLKMMLICYERLLSGQFNLHWVATGVYP